MAWVLHFPSSERANADTMDRSGRPKDVSGRPSTGGDKMSFNPLEEKGIPLEKQLRSWSELNVKPYDKDQVHPYSRTRGILMNGVEVEAVMFSHQMARNTLDSEVKKMLAYLRRIEAQQQKAINWLIPGDESTIEVTLGYEQVAVDLTAWVAQNEADPYLKQVYDFALLEDFDHLYRYANLYQLIEGKKADQVCDDLTEIMPGRPTIFEHRDPRDEIRRPMTALAAEPQSVLNALTLLAGEQQTMNFYMTIGNRYQEPLARATYAEIALIEEQHVTHYESILDPAASWLENLVLHQWHECWLYWSFMQDEPDSRVRSLYELHCNMEIEHLRVACELMKTIEKRDPEMLLPAAGFERAMKFQPNKAYVRQVLEREVDVTSKHSDFVPVATLPDNDRYFQYQRQVNGDWCPTEEVISENSKKNGRDYRLETEGPHPVPGLRGDGETEYARRRTAA
jgi:rubrerythrin